MDTISSAFPAHEYVDFKAISEAAARSVRLLVDRYLPGGRWEGKEYVVRNPTRNDQRPGSFKVREDGVWCDFAIGKEESGDFITLVSRLTGKTALDAARELMDLLKVPPGASSSSLTGNIRPLARSQMRIEASLMNAR
jgi:putative DNA primase/helicase